ncbi:outer membrane lipid asymmetry maintenance protein MlaD [Paracoccus aminophilus]|uniref:Putative toluene transport system protein n=1 Tax=Paracoccus aminophilus JCM 7686 TaxID=1367847 RepID=S5YB63_PARAH|nr:outer membrane lipid asymmetry maintenance protein MlaD [Paracoccus aminophilus]AGT08678.1 putative toluene transport system protein [Paracoccus aminophilus JCM 7686]
MTSTAERAEFWVGAAVLAVAVAFLGWSASGGKLFGTHFGATYDLRAAFPNVDGIDTGTDVRIGGVKVGRVSAVRLNPTTFQAEATLSVPSEFKLPIDTAALIQSNGLLGGAYIELQPGGATENLAPGDEIEDVQGAVSLISLMMKFVDSQSGPKKSDETSTEKGAQP